MKLLFETYRPGEFVETNRVINTPSKFAKKALFYVQETGYLKSLKSHLSQRSNLASYLFCIVLSGRGIFSYEGHIHSLHPNEGIFIDCMKPYSHQSDPQYPWELLWVHFNGAAAKSYYEYFYQSGESVIRPKEPEKYLQMINELIKIHQKKELSWELLASKLITDLLTMCITEKQETGETESTILNKLQAVENHLNQNFTQKICLDQLAETFYISKYHLCREYKRLFGVTIIHSITAKRITYAKELLRFTGKSIEEIAEACGYPDASYFNKVFQRTEAMTGSDYRKKWKG